jgi:hypothetical protein
MLVNAASRGMLTVSGECDPADVMSAYMTMVRNGIEYVLERAQTDVDREHNRSEIIDKLLELFALAEGKTN